MKRSKIITVFCVLIGVAGTLFFIRSIQKKQVPTPREMITDSLKIAVQKAEMHKDSALFYQAKTLQHEYSLDSVRHLDSLGWDQLRSRYLSDLEKRIRANESGSTGQRDSLRIPQTDRVQSETRKRPAP